MDLASAADGTERRVSVVMCTRERPVSLARALDSVLATSPAPLEIIVVDNARASTATEEVVQARSAGAVPVRYVTEPRPGLSRARNRGVAQARGDVIAFTDDDVCVATSWVQAIQRGFARDSAVGCVTGRIEPMHLDTFAQRYFHRRVAWPDSQIPRLYSREPAAGDSPLHPYASGAFGAGANFALSRETLQQVGGFDELLGAGSESQGGEDLDIFVRVLLHDFLLSYEPDAVVWHEHRADSEGLRRQMFNYGTGLSAYLTKYMLREQSRRFLLRNAAAIAVTARRMIPKDSEGSERIPGASGFVWAERRGFVAGPYLYLRSRFRNRKRVGRADQGLARSVPDGSRRSGLAAGRKSGPVAGTVCAATTLLSYGFLALSRLFGAVGIESARRACIRLGHAMVLTYLRRASRATIDAYAAAPHLPSSATGAPKVWLMWWQGEEQAPEIVKICLASMRRYLPAAVDVTVITEANFGEYVQIDDVFLSRLAAGEMSLMQFSNVVRVALLHRHGGLWIDATHLALREFPAHIFELPFYSGHVRPHSPVHDRYVQDGRWFANLIGGAPGNPVFQFVYDLFLDHWSSHRRALHYDQFDYAFALAYEQNIGGFRDAVDALDYNHQDSLDLRWILKQPFDPEVLERFVQSETDLYKLDRRFQLSGSDADGTFYGYLRQRFLDQGASDG